MNSSNSRLIVGLIGIVGYIIWYFLGDFFESGGVNFLFNLSKIITSNPGFWIMITVATIFGLYRKLTNKDEFLWRELPIQLTVSSLVILTLYLTFFSTSTDINDTEVWNGHVTKAEYYEGWTEETTSTDKDGNKHTSHTQHPPSWKVLSTVGEFTSTQGVYANYRRHFSGEKKEILMHAGQVSIGDGNMYYIECEGRGKDTIPASRPHLFVNYLRASDSIRKLRGNIDTYKAYLQPYPNVQDGPFGAIEFNRVVVAGANVPAGWVTAVDGKLDHELKTLSPRKEVNVVVYVVGSKDRNFANALREFWIQGKKNDVLVVVGASQFPKADWFEIIAWTKVEEFPIQLRNRLMDLESLTKTDDFVRAIVEEIAKPQNQGGFVRTPMSDYDYLLSDISLPIWCQVVIILIGGAVSWFTSVLLVNNRLRVWTSTRSWQTGFLRRKNNW